MLNNQNATFVEHSLPVATQGRNEEITLRDGRLMCIALMLLIGAMFLSMAWHFHPKLRRLLQSYRSIGELVRGEMLARDAPRIVRPKSRDKYQNYFTYTYNLRRYTKLFVTRDGPVSRSDMRVPVEVLVLPGHPRSGLVVRYVNEQLDGSVKRMIPILLTVLGLFFVGWAVFLFVFLLGVPIWAVMLMTPVIWLLGHWGARLDYMYARWNIMEKVYGPIAEDNIDPERHQNRNGYAKIT